MNIYKMSPSGFSLQNLMLFNDSPRLFTSIQFSTYLSNKLHNQTINKKLLLKYQHITEFWTGRLQRAMK